MTEMHDSSAPPQTTRTRLADAAATPWREGVTEGVRFRCQVLLDGAGGGPEALRFRFEPTPSVYAHMHLTAQFQVVLDGEMTMPRGRMDLRRLGVQYTDRNVPYGPFGARGGHDMLVLHPRAGGLVPMADAEARRHINLGGRLVVASPEGASWEDAGQGCRRALLMSRGEDVRVVLVEARAGASLPSPSARYGCYEVVVAGSVAVDGVTLTAPGLRHALGAPPGALVAGPAGASVMALSFDAEALLGGVGGDGLPEDARVAAAL